jgi:hypothetical protein
MPTGTTGTTAWVVLVIEDINARMAAPQVVALQSAALATSQVQPFTAVMPDVVRRVRQYIASNPRNRLSQTENSIPPELKGTTCWLILQEMAARLSIAIKLSDDQKEEIKRANDDLDKLRNIVAPWLLISQPDDPEENPEIRLSGNATVLRSTTRKVTRESMAAI